jgi:AcrR family transcriptional regulator
MTAGGAERAVAPAGGAAGGTVAATPRGSGRAAITTAAREIFAERGYHGTSIRDIAERAGLSLSALYYWHPSKQHLLAALLEESTQDYFSTCAEALAAAGADPVARLRAMVAASIEYRVRRRIESNLTTREWRNLDPDLRERVDALRRDATALWAEVIQEGVAAGAFHCAHPDDARRAIVAACNAVAQWYEPTGELGLPDLVERYTDIALRIVDARPA